MTTNEQRSEREVSEFLSHPPDQVFAYYSQDPAVGGHIGNWMGAKLGTITWVGKISRPMGGKVVSIRMKAINGLIYAGKCNLSSGTYCRLRRVAPKLYSERDPGSRQLDASPLSGPRKDARDRAIDLASVMARRTRTDYAVWMDSQGRFLVHLATAAPWKSTIAVAHAPMGHLSYKRYEGQERKTRRDPGLRRGSSDSSQTHGRGKLRRELGPIGNAIWHLPKRSPWIIYWNGPGARLLFGTNKPGARLSPIDFSGADGNYRTLKEATAAVNRFWKDVPGNWIS